MTALDRQPAPRRRPRRAIAGMAVAIAAIAGGGAAVAATTLSSPEADSDAIISDAAGRLGVEPEALNDALRAAYEARIDEQVKSGELSQDEADALKERVEAGDVPLVGAPGLRHFRDGDGPLGGGRLERHVLVDLGAAAAYLGLDAEALRTQLEDGKTLAQVAEAQGKTVAGLKQALTDAASQALDERVAAGDLSAERKAEILERMSAELDRAIAGEMPRGGPFGRGHHGPGFGGPGLGEHGLRAGVRVGLEAAATYLGLDEATLRQRLFAGESLAEIATAEGKTADGLEQALTDAITKQLDEQVAAGDLTEEQKAEILADLPARLDEQLDRTFDGPRHFRFRGGDDAPTPAAPGAPAPDERAPGSAPSEDSGDTTATATPSI